MTSQLQLMWKEMQDDAQIENLRMIRWQVICDECKKRSFEQYYKNAESLTLQRLTSNWSVEETP